MKTVLRVEMLGRLGLRQGSREICRFRTQKTGALLAYLAYYKRRSHPRDVLIELFWPDSALEAARTNLSVALNALRRQLEAPGIPSGAILMADRAQVRLNPMAFTTDVEEFALLGQEAGSETEAEKRIALQIAAIDLYHGDLLPGFYEDWIVAERNLLRDAYLSTLKQIVKGYAETRRYERAIEYAHRMVQADPLRERTYHHLMQLYLAVGRPEDALAQYKALEKLLQRELQRDPSTPLRELAATLPQRDQAAPPRRLFVEARPAENRRSASAAELRSPRPDASPPTPRLPLPFTRFFGQETESAYLTELLCMQEPEERAVENGERREVVSRLITLTGPGGTGKTRLSIEVAGRVKAAFPGGVWFVPLAELVDPLRLGEALRDVLELPHQTHPAALDQVIALLNGLEKRVLLILDNFEQITSGGAPVVWTLLNQVRSLRCLVTSRQPLSLPGEREIPVLPLPTPAGEPRTSLPSLLPTHLLTYPSVALFVDRAQAVRPEFQITPRNAEAIAALCEKLEGLPLAIELAAARARALTPAQILDRLAQRFELLTARRAEHGERHRSLWAAMDWSYHLLPPGLQRFFARLSVFHGGWSLEAAEAVCEEPAALDYLAQLRGHSLLLAEESSLSLRFRMLETVREFAAEQLTPEERKETARRHAAYFHAWVTGADLSGSEQLGWYERFEEDLDNLRAVLTWSLHEENEIEIGLQTASELLVFWRVRGHLSEGLRWYARLLECAGEAPTVGLGRALRSAGALTSLMGDFQAARSLLERCREVALAVGDENGLTIVHNDLGSNAFRQGDYEQARLAYDAHFALARAQGGRGQMAGALTSLANVAQVTGDFAASRALHTESLGMWRALGDRVGEARTLHNLAILALSEKQLAEARSCFEQSLAIKRGFADHYGISSTLLGMAEVAKDQGDYAAAAAYARESLDLARGQNMRANLVDILHLLIELVRAIGEWEVAARLYGVLERVREEMNYPLQPADREAYAPIQAALRKSLGTAVYEAARAKGIGLSLEQALACLEETLASRSL